MSHSAPLVWLPPPSQTPSPPAPLPSSPPHTLQPQHSDYNIIQTACHQRDEAALGVCPSLGSSATWSMVEWVRCFLQSLAENREPPKKMTPTPVTWDTKNDCSPGYISSYHLSSWIPVILSTWREPWQSNETREFEWRHLIAVDSDTLQSSCNSERMVIGRRRTSVDSIIIDMICYADLSRQMPKLNTK